MIIIGSLSRIRGINLCTHLIFATIFTTTGCVKKVPKYTIFTIGTCKNCITQSKNFTHSFLINITKLSSCFSYRISVIMIFILLKNIITVNFPKNSTCFKTKVLVTNPYYAFSFQGISIIMILLRILLQCIFLRIRCYFWGKSMRNVSYNGRWGEDSTIRNALQNEQLDI